MQVSRFAQMLRYLGPKWLMYRCAYALRMKSGLMRMQRPATTWDKQSLATFLRDQSLNDSDAHATFRSAAASRFFFAPPDRRNAQSCLSQWDGSESSPLFTAQSNPGGVLPVLLPRVCQHRASTPVASRSSLGAHVPDRQTLEPDRGFRGGRYQAGLGNKSLRLRFSTGSEPIGERAMTLLQSCSGA